MINYNSKKIDLKNVINDNFGKKKKKIVFSFECYLKNKCEIDKIVKDGNNKILIEILSFVSAMPYSNDSVYNTIKINGIICKPVKYGENYKFLFDGIKGVSNSKKYLMDIMEIYKKSNKHTIRIFGFEVENIFYIRAITKEHL